MAEPLLWPGGYHFYPIGSHAALCLTRDLPPEQGARLLLLPCGDPRNVLYTVYSEASCIRKLLDFTCCDFDAGILARDILLLAMIMDDIPTVIVWKVYLDMYLDAEARLAFTAVCRQLVEESQTPETWRASSHGSTLRMATDFTLEEVRRQWFLYLAAATATGDRASELRRLMDEGRQRVLSQHYVTSHGATVFATGRSAGPLILRAFPVYTEHLHHYWNTGTTALTHAPGSLTGSYVNPTFLYSRVGEGFAVHHGSDPLAPFHLAHVFGNARDTPTAHRVVGAALEELRAWCDAFRTRTSNTAEGSRLLVRFFLGDVLVISRTLQARNGHSNLQTNTMSPWSIQAPLLSTLEYDHARAPTRFDVIDTSNICDYIGLVNVLLSCVPLLVDHSPSSGVLYTESFIALTDKSNPVQQLQSMLVANLPTQTLLFGVAPVGALSGFTTHCDTHELLLRQEREKLVGVKSSEQHHQPITWKRPWTADFHFVELTRSPVLIQLSPAQLSLLLFRVYEHLFGAENPLRLSGRNGVLLRASTICYTRETFVLFLRSLRSRLCLTEVQWFNTMELFLDRQRATAIAENVFDSLSHREFTTLLYRYRLLDMPLQADVRRPRVGRISLWTTIPPLTRVYLVVPSSKLAVLQRSTPELANPPLHCVLQFPRSEDIFQSVHAVFGRIISVGTPSSPSVAVQTEGGVGIVSTSSPLVLSFVVPTLALTNIAEPNQVTIRLSLRTNPATVMAFGPILGHDLSVFSASLEDTRYVHVVPEDARFPPQPLGSLDTEISSREPAAIGRPCPIRVEIEEQTNSVALTARLLVEDATARHAFSGGITPTLVQTSPCSMRIMVGSQVQFLLFPVPIAGSKYRARLARRSSYIEVTVPVSIPFVENRDGTTLDPFPIARVGTTFSAWNMHHVNLDQQPALDTRNPTLASWFDRHISSQFSSRERVTMGGESAPSRDTFTLLKGIIRHMLNKTVGHRSGRAVFALRNSTTNDIDMVVFIRSLRYDLSSHTIVCDAFALSPCSDPTLALEPLPVRLERSGIAMTSIRIDANEMRAWRQLLPALAERCRTSWIHGPSCGYTAAGEIPLSTEIDIVDPLCSCGRGRDVEGMGEVELWHDFAPLATRIALSPLFAVSYLEEVNLEDLGDIATPFNAPSRCSKCHRSGRPRELKRCVRCKTALYCSKTCQRADWPTHKLACATVVTS